MYRKTPLLLFLLLVFLPGCNDEPERASIVGRWEADRADLEAFSGGIRFYNRTDEDIQAEVEFKEDGLVTLNADGRVSSGTYQVNNNQLTTTIDFIGDVDFGSEFIIEELTGLRLRLSAEKDTTANVPTLGNVNGTVRATIQFTRILP
jgi:hypothetical protein